MKARNHLQIKGNCKHEQLIRHCQKNSHLLFRLLSMNHHCQTNPTRPTIKIVWKKKRHISIPKLTCHHDRIHCPPFSLFPSHHSSLLHSSTKNNQKMKLNISDWKKKNQSWAFESEDLQLNLMLWLLQAVKMSSWGLTCTCASCGGENWQAELEKQRVVVINGGGVLVGWVMSVVVGCLGLWVVICQ